MSISSSATRVVERYVQYVGNNPIESTQMTSEDVEELREEYLRIFDKSGRTKEEALAHLRQNFELAKELFVDERTEGASDEPFELLYNGCVHIIPPNTPVLVGIFGDISTLREYGNSRVQFIVYYYPTRQISNKPVSGGKGVVIIIDPGSMSGLKFDEGTTTVPSSLPDARNLIVFSPTETMAFAVPGVDKKYIFNPKKCVVCMDACRSIKLQCGHFVLCSACAPRCTRCPVCRATDINAFHFSGCFSNG